MAARPPATAQSVPPHSNTNFLKNINVLTDKDIEEIRREFPILERKVYGKPLVYLDNTATSQTPQRVVDEVVRMYTEHHANVHRGVHCMSQEATDLMEKARGDVARFIGAGSDAEVIFTRGTTEGINLAASSYCQLLEPGDEVVLTVMEHHSNIVPWQLQAKRQGLKIKAVPIKADGSLDMDAYRAAFTDRTRVAAFAHVSNVLGTVNPVKEMVRTAHEHGCVALVDGAQAVAHYKVDVQDIDADFYAFSSHKMYGPTGVGVLYGKRELLEKMPPYQGGGEMIDHVSFEGTTFAELPFKFEAGTPDYTAIPALSRAIEFIEGIGIENIEAHEQRLMSHVMERLGRELPQLRVFGTAPGKCPVLSFLVGDSHSYDVGVMLDKLGYALRTGHHCAQPLIDHFGIPGTVRASFAAYNTKEEVDILVEGIKRAVKMFS